jgi:hypothetical protein
LPKLGRRSNNDVAVNDNDHLEQGSIEEESGDRWLGSDLAKSLRFYQKAYTHYLAAIAQDPKAIDPYYNSSRLLFHVYSQYSRTDGVDVGRLDNVDEVVSSTNSVLQPLEFIVQCHEQALDVVLHNNATPSLDLLYNTAMVYIEVLESEQDNPSGDFGSNLQLAIKCRDLFSSIIETQLNQFQQFLAELLKIDEPTSQSQSQSQLQLQLQQPAAQQSSKEEQYTSEEVVQPTDIYDSIFNSYKLVQALLENVTESQQIELVNQEFSSFITSCESKANSLIEQFSDLSTSKNEMVDNLTTAQINDLKVVKTVIQGLCLTDINEGIEIWNQPGLPETAARYMLANDMFQTTIDRYDMATTDEDLYWKTLTTMTNYLKKAQEILQREMNDMKKSTSQLGLGQLITQISNLVIARADIDVQRSQVNNEAGIKNRDLLIQNAKVFLKNAMNISKTSGGLRERASEKLQRQKSLLDAVIRMCVLEQKTSTAELDEIMGRDTWIRELPELVKLGYYNSFGANSIEIPRF